jgi:hypothetical protein
MDGSDRVDGVCVTATGWPGSVVRGDLPEATQRRTSAMGASAASGSRQEEPEPMIKGNISEKERSLTGAITCVEGASASERSPCC